MTRNSSSPIGGGSVLLPRWHVCFQACHTTLAREFASVRKLCSSRRVHMKVQPWVRASVEDLEDLRQDVHMAPLNSANTICTNECGPGRTLEMEGSSSRVLVYTTTS